MAVTGVVSVLCRRTLSAKSFLLGISKRGNNPVLFKGKQQLAVNNEILKATFSSHQRLQDKSYETTSVQVSEKGKLCDIVWKDGLVTEFHSIWIRHNCHCSQCRHATGQKLMLPSQISTDLRIQDVCLKDDYLHFTWNNEKDHTGILPLKYIRDHNYNDETILQKRQAVRMVYPDRIPTVSYEGIINSTNEYVKWLQQINKYGFSIVQDVPLEEHMVKKVGELIAPLWTSIYGDIFDVISLPSPTNIAYSSHMLDFHMDLVYFQSPPGLQLLHCLKFDDCVEGGLSIFVDVFQVAEEFRTHFPDLFHVLTTVPATFQKVHYDRDLPVHIVNQKPHIKLNHKGDIVAIYWAPGFEGPLSVTGKDVENYYRAYEMFAKAINDSSHQLKHRLQPGELIVFNNLRTLHSRTQFKLNGGSRHLQGCYINIDMFKSQTQVFNTLHSNGCLAKRVGNECWF